MSGPTPSRSLSDILHEVFGHREFRPHQQKVCEAAAAGNDVLLVMPTGAGKSLCYQLPALARNGTALVVSPLIALMDDQASKLTALGLNVARIHSGLSRDDARKACRDYLDGALDFLFIAPERLRVPGFPEMLAKRKPALIAIDEAHCISQWGHDFRPDYRTLGQYLPALRPAPIVALTATATPNVREDIARQLNLQTPSIFVTGFRRDNLAVEVVELSKPQRTPYIAKLLGDAGSRPAIVYAPSRKAAEELASELNRKFPAAAYHAGLVPAVREQVQTAFLTGKMEVVVATIAFGMGIDKANVRTVLHAALPASVEGYYQEIGRAGRDGLPSRSVLLHGFADRRLQEFFLEKSYPAVNDLDRVVRILPEDFTDLNTLHNAVLKTKHAMDRETLDRCIEKLLAAGVLQMDMEGNVRKSEDATENLSSRPERSAVERPAVRQGWQQNYEQQVAFRRSQIDRMIAFAESTTCRMASLVRHFGDTSDRLDRCGMCDICNPSGSSSSASAHQPTNDERSHLRTILRALEGRSTSTGKLFTDLHLTRERNDFDTLLDALARAGLISISNDTFRNPEGKDITYKKAALTFEGRLTGNPITDEATLDTVWIRGGSSAPSSKKSRKGVGAPRPDSRTRDEQKSKPSELTPEALLLFDRLRDWRKEQAAPQKMPAFMVLSDAVLRSIAAANPQNLTALFAISGMGQSKIDRYGAGILSVTRNDEGAAGNTRSSSGLQSTEKRPTEKRASAPARPTTTSKAGAPLMASSSDAMHGRATSPGGSATRSPLSNQPVQLTPPAPPTNKPFTPEQQTLATSLKTWRQEQATKAGLPTFFILADTTIDQIVRAQPQSLTELEAVRGFAREKLDRFGPDLIQLCRA